MKILVFGGTRFFGIPMVKELLEQGHEITIATRGKAKDTFGNAVKRVILQRTEQESLRKVFNGQHYDVVIDKIAYCSNDIRILMEVIDCDQYIYMSSTAVYEPKHMNTVESNFDGKMGKLVWCNRKDFEYAEIKRQAARALCQKYGEKSWIEVRYPFVLGEDDYTKRLLFYVEHTMKAMPMYIDNIDCQMSFIRSDEAGKFIAYLAENKSNKVNKLESFMQEGKNDEKKEESKEKEVREERYNREKCREEQTTPMHYIYNGASAGTISVREIMTYVEEKTGTKAILTKEGDAAPYNGEPDYSINTEKAAEAGFQFTNLKDWIYDLLDYYIERVRKDML